MVDWSRLFGNVLPKEKQSVAPIEDEKSKAIYQSLTPYLPSVDGGKLPDINYGSNQELVLRLYYSQGNDPETYQNGIIICFGKDRIGIGESGSEYSNLPINAITKIIDSRGLSVYSSDEMEKRYLEILGG